jgi:hypothetical protein
LCSPAATFINKSFYFLPAYIENIHRDMLRRWNMKYNPRLTIEWIWIITQLIGKRYFRRIIPNIGDKLCEGYIVNKDIMVGAAGLT